MLSRRQFLTQSAAAFALIAAGGLAACGDPRQANKLSFLNWQDYIDQRLLDDFTTRSGIEVTYETYESNDELARRLAQAQRVREGGRSGTSFDLIVPSDNFVTRFRNADLLAEIDPDGIPNLSNLDDVFRREEFDPGNRFSVPWATGTTGIGYDTTVFTTPPGYEIFADPATAGQTSILNETRDAFALALFDLGLDPNTSTESEIEQAADRLIAMKGAGAVFDSSGYLDRLVAGEVAAAQAYSSDLLQAQESNPNLAFVLPESGGLRWVDSLAIPSGSPRPANSLRFIDFYLEPEISASNSVAVRVDTGNKAARDFLPDEILNDPVVFPPDEILDRLFFTADLGDAENLYDAAWKRVQEA
ncbi:MAG TPA: spermidine/putrescine ABC transporter substrate-binding protein [Acidimicrobiia bacterium]|nr:spermidine/putrescine ABC transporter substrate-binding protein [Acidimicrobiia bacterium]